jgi:hypothetical protein
MTHVLDRGLRRLHRSAPPSRSFQATGDHVQRFAGEFCRGVPSGVGEGARDDVLRQGVIRSVTVGWVDDPRLVRRDATRWRPAANSMQSTFLEAGRCVVASAA